MKLAVRMMMMAVVFVALPVQALDPAAPREERRFGTVYVKTPNVKDKVVLESQRLDKKRQKIPSLEDVKVRVGDYLVKVKIKPNYSYEQAVTVRPTERHEVIVPGFGNLRVNGKCGTVEIFQGGSRVAKTRCGKIRTLPRGNYDLKIQKGKITFDQNVAVVTNTLRELDVQ